MFCTPKINSLSIFFNAKLNQAQKSKNSKPRSILKTIHAADSLWQYTFCFFWQAYLTIASHYELCVFSQAAILSAYFLQISPHDWHLVLSERRPHFPHFSKFSPYKLTPIPGTQKKAGAMLFAQHPLKLIYLN